MNLEKSVKTTEDEGVVEIGLVSQETKGWTFGLVWDGGVGKYTGG